LAPQTPEHRGSLDQVPQPHQIDDHYVHLRSLNTATLKRNLGPESETHPTFSRGKVSTSKNSLNSPFPKGGVRGDL
jgi:hypothetical protein